MKNTLSKQILSIVGILFLFLVCSCRTVQPGKLEQPLHYIDDVVIEYPGFSLLYDTSHKQARWVAYELTREEAVSRTASRSDSFFPDLRIPGGTATNEDYYKSGYDRGHLAPAADMAFSEESMNASFYYSNISPQNPSFNRGVWARLEELVRFWAIELGTVYVVTGPILPTYKSNQTNETIGENQVTVPLFFYKAVLFVSENETMGIAFIVPNIGSKNSLDFYAVSIDYVEKQTALDFFPGLPDTIENNIERAFNFSQWPRIQ